MLAYSSTVESGRFITVRFRFDPGYAYQFCSGWQGTADLTWLIPTYSRFDSAARHQSRGPLTSGDSEPCRGYGQSTPAPRGVPFCRIGVVGSARLPEEQKVPVRSGGSARGSRPMVGPQFSKLMMPVQSRSSAPFCAGPVRDSQRESRSLPRQ